MGYSLEEDYENRLCTLWGLLQDERIIIAISNGARYIFNWQCAELVEVFANIAKMEWQSDIYPGSSIEQLGFDVLRQLIAADIEQFYKDATNNVHQNNYGVIPEKESSTNTIFLNHSHPVTTIAPGKQYTNEIADLSHDKAKEINSLCDQLMSKSRKLLNATRWAQKTYPHRPKPFQHSTAMKDLLAEALEEVDNLATYFPDRMPYACYRPLQRCIHCKGKHDSEDHHLSLGIPTLPDPDPENVQATALPTTITPKQDHTNNRYKTLGAPLPSQHLAYHQWQTITQHSLSTNLPSLHSMLANVSPGSTRRQPTSSTFNPTSNYKDSYHHPCRQQGPSMTRPGNSLPSTSGGNRKSSARSASSSNGRKTSTTMSSNYSRKQQKQQTMAGTTKPGKHNCLRYDNDNFDDP